MRYVDVILPLPLDGLFTYSFKDDENLEAGMRVVVPLGKSKTYTAIVLRIHQEKPSFRVRPILSVLDEQPVLLEVQLRLWQWIADYYLSPPGEVYKAALPSGLKTAEGFRPRMETYVRLADAYCNEQALHLALSSLRRALRQQETFCTFLQLSHWDTVEGTTAREPIEEVSKDELMNESHCTASTFRALLDRGLLTVYNKEVGRLNATGDYRPDLMKPLNADQTAAFSSIGKQFDQKQVVLLHGVTSSGKTEIYIHLIREALERHQQVLYLLPEIALTVQITKRLQRVFGSRLGIYHSKYSDAERVEMWRKQLSDESYDVILGARSAVFLPFRRLGLVIIDEEHESSFKQQDAAPRYHARSVAIMLAHMSGAKVLLGTATPSIESYHNAQTGKYGYVSLTHRYKDIALPRIEVEDMKDLYRRKMMEGAFSPRLLEAVDHALKSGKQAILFQNRRGYAPMAECRECGWVPRCPNCDVSLTMHSNQESLVCHYCGYTIPIPTRCPNCESTSLRDRGIGTEKLEEAVSKRFPEARVARLDLDTTRSRLAYDHIISSFASGKTNVLVGTQMVTKGLDFDNVAVVGILNADTMLNYPDFRATEQAFNMLSQVSGRAGRKGEQGLVILQTRNAELPLIHQVISNDYEGYYSSLIEERQFFRYPPFYHLVYADLRHRDDLVLDHAAEDMAQRLQAIFPDRVLGPDKPAIGRIKQLFIRRIVLKLEQGIDLKRARTCLREVQHALLTDVRYGALQIFYDVDPM